METIFKNPIIFDGEKDNVVLFYSKYIIGNIKKEVADLSIEGIDRDLLHASRFDCIVKIKEVFAYKFKPGNDSHITFGVKNVTGTKYITIDFKDAETTRQAEISFMEEFKQLGFKRREERLTPVKAATFPVLFSIFVAIAGSLLAWFAYDLEFYELTQAKIVNGYLYLFERALQIIGCYPILILTVLLQALCLFWVFKKISNLPSKISARK